MAIYHFSMRAHNRADGRSGVGGAAYRHGTRLKDQELGWTSSYKDKLVEASGLVVPEGEKMMGLSQLWNAAEAAEKRKDAKVAREIDMALPIELDLDAQKRAVKRMAEWLVKEYGIAVDWAIHGDDPGNPHAHLGLTTRRLVGGKFTEKTRELDDVKTGPGHVIAMRKQWAQIANLTLAEEGIDVRIDHRSLKDQGIDRQPGHHWGPQSAEHLLLLAQRQAAKVAAEAERFAREVLRTKRAMVSRHEQAKKAQLAAQKNRSRRPVPTPPMPR